MNPLKEALATLTIDQRAALLDTVFNVMAEGYDLEMWVRPRRDGTPHLQFAISAGDDSIPPFRNGVGMSELPELATMIRKGVEFMNEVPGERVCE